MSIRRKGIIRTAAVLAAAMMMALLAAGCGREKEPDEYMLRYSAVGEVFDTGELKAVCPVGWYKTDAYDLYKSTSKPVKNALVFVKGGESVAEDHPYIRMVLHGAEEEFDVPDPAEYDGSSDIAPFATGNDRWTGFTARVGNEPFVWLTTSSEKGTFEVWLWTHPDGVVSADLSDNDIHMILESLTVTKKK